LVDTGVDTMTGGRLKRVEPYLKDEDLFCFTYGDGLSDINISKLIEFHKNQKTKATLTAVLSPGRFGALDINKNIVESFNEKPLGDGHMINGGFFVLSHSVIDYIETDKTIWERSPLESLSKEGDLSAYKHHGFWHAMDTLRDKNYLEKLWTEGRAPWKVWE
jgi:glucose-1-phosphate cytidylyltransferase